jgi:outer membrane protein TolC
VTGPRALVLAAAVLAGCAPVGPDFTGAPNAAPAANDRSGFLRGESETVAAEPQSQWWLAFGDPALDRLVESGLAANTDIAAATSRLLQARAMLRGAEADRGPSGSISGGYTRSLPSFAQFGVNFPGIALKDFDLYQANFDASWEIDLFGGQRRAAEAASDQTKAALADIADIRLSVAADIAEAYLDLRGQQARLGLLARSSDIDGEQVRLTEMRIADGAAAALDRERIAAQREATLAEMPAAQAAIAADLDRLAVLTAAEPGALDAALTPPGGRAPAPAPAGQGRRRRSGRAAAAAAGH